jgi:hypothetical protein
MMEIVEGVKEGDQVVVTGQQNLFEKAKVQIQSATKSQESGVVSQESKQGNK